MVLQIWVSVRSRFGGLSQPSSCKEVMKQYTLPRQRVDDLSGLELLDGGIQGLF